MKKKTKIWICSLLVLGFVFIFTSSCEKDDLKREDKFAEGSVGFYYNPPTLVGNYIYIGTSRGSNWDLASDNNFFKPNLNLTKVWEYSLGNKDVRGGQHLIIMVIYILLLLREDLMEIILIQNYTYIH
ncbi:MAG: hypothetical protein H8E34_10115 [Bacteroidetes bacterium]|nr:hypothetical protein [Bacteroidota bacterium]MBL6944511.1 hypothetical protein [Bacteroidales bacterium]